MFKCENRRFTNWSQPISVKNYTSMKYKKSDRQLLSRLFATTISQFFNLHYISFVTIQQIFAINTYLYILITNDW